MKRKGLLAILLGTIIASALVWVFRDRSVHTTPDSTTSSLSLKSPLLETLDLTDTHRRRMSTVYTYEGNGCILRIEVLRSIDSRSAQTLEEDGIMGIEALYANALSPYPGDISRRIVVKKAFRPRLYRKTVGGRERSYFLLFANERLGFGAGTAATIMYKCLVGWLHCMETQSFYRVKYYTPKETEDRELEGMFGLLGCE